MTQKRASVLLPMPMPTQKSLRAAVAQIIRRVQLEKHLTDEELADELGISIGTVRNARNEQADLNATTIARIGAKFGGEVLDPYAALYGARNVPIEVSDLDALPSLTGSVHRLAVAQSVGSEGGAQITHTELLAMMPEIRAAQAALNALVARAERIAA
jgi:transcriptional regulator with XRE-family HTH domain